MNSTAKGNKAELDAWEWIEAGEWPYGGGWMVGTRRKGRREKGPGDHLVYKFGERGVLAEVKESKRSPWQDFSPAERATMLDCAKRHSLVPVLIWRAAPSKPFTLLEEWEWPG